MPHNSNIPVKVKPANVLNGEIPKTKFIDNLDSVDVNLIHWPDNKTDLVGHAFQKATWENDPFLPGFNEERDNEIKQDLRILAFEGKGLPLSLELYDFVFCVDGISRIITHQIVRNRIGATYSQQASGDKDWRHHNVLVPRSVYHNQKCWPKFKQRVLEAKMLYAEMLDTMEIPILEARRVLPHCLQTFIYVKFNLVTIINFIRKRVCVQTQEPEMVIVARRMREKVLEKFPHLSDMLENQCKLGRCYYTVSDRQVGTSMFLPDEDHDFQYNSENFIYKQNIHEMIYDLPPVKEEKYLGYEKVA